MTGHFEVPHTGRAGIEIQKPIKLHVGPVPSVVAGRTDHLPLHVPSGSYVLPADVVSSFGQGNTQAGFLHVHRLFEGTPYGGQTSPYGQGHGVYGMMKRGGRTTEHEDGVPVVVAGGEVILSPEQVKAVGEGDMDKGHKVLDEFVKRSRAELVKTLKALPGPSKN
jgi:hypothetical protein